MVQKDVVAKTNEFYGKQEQSIICMEECAELIQAISKELRGKHDHDHLAEEIGDVLICIEILKQLYGITDEELNEWTDAKTQRALDRMKVGEH